MPIIINEFEVITTSPLQNQAMAPTSSASKPALPGPTPYDVARIIRQQKERCARVRAH